MTESMNPPTASKQFDRVQVAIWRHEPDADGPARARWDVTLSRSYRDAQDNWQRTHRFSPRDLPHLKLAIDWAMHELLLKDE